MEGSPCCSVLRVDPVACGPGRRGLLSGALLARPSRARPAHGGRHLRPVVDLPSGLDRRISCPPSENDCVAGRPAASRQTLKELNRILEESGKRCAHHAVFALAYTRITQTYAWSRDLPGNYEDVPFANHQDAVFAKYYTDAWTNWRNGNRAAVAEGVAHRLRRGGRRAGDRYG